MAPRVIIETFNVPDQGDGDPPEISQVSQQLDWKGAILFYDFMSIVLYFTMPMSQCSFFPPSRLSQLFLVLLDFQLLEFLVMGLMSR